MQRSIVLLHIDEHGDWVAELDCQHNQHVGHNPPWMMREWVLSESGRQSRLGEKLNCVKCDRQEPVDRVNTNSPNE